MEFELREQYSYKTTFGLNIDRLSPDFFESELISELKTNPSHFTEKCCIWGTPSAVALLNNQTENNKEYMLFNSPRAGGFYIASKEIADKGDIAETDYFAEGDGFQKMWMDIKKIQKNFLTTWLIEQRKVTPAPIIKTSDIGIIKALNKKKTYQRIESLLQFISKEYDTGIYWQVYSGIKRSDVDCPFIPSKAMFLAHSESLNCDEFFNLLDHMKEKNLIDFVEGGDVARIHDSWHKERNYGGWIKLTTKGRIQAEENKNSNQAFIAMPFEKNEFLNCFYRAVKEAVKRAGYDACRLDDKYKRGLIDNNLIESIEKSKFLIADLTNGNRGVYYEVGYAHKARIPVIFTCKKDETEHVHFDLDHHNQIYWEHDNLEKFISALETAICDDEEIGRGFSP